jgi:YebC/PmpR family DNA-binding regulatory protein
MSGHSKWATIKRKKAAIDAKRGKLFTKLLKEIQVAAKVGGPSPDGNPRLKTAIAAAKSQSVPNDNIDRSIKRGAGDSDGVDYEEIVYEGYGPGGVALIIKALTDNRNRTVSEVRHALTKAGGSMGSSNSVAYLFQEKGVFTFSKAEISEEQLFEVAMDAGAEDIRDEGEQWQVLSAPSDFGPVRDVLEKLGKKFEGELVPLPEMSVRVEGDNAQALIRLLDALDDLDDVQSVYGNFEIDEKILAEA